MKTLMVLIFFLLLGAFFVIAENNLHLNKANNIETFLGLYFNWIGELTGNAEIVTGYMAKMEWLPDER